MLARLIAREFIPVHAELEDSSVENLQFYKIRLMEIKKKIRLK